MEPSGTEPYYDQVSLTPSLPQLNLVVQSPTTPGQFDSLLKLNLVVQSPTTPGQFDPYPTLNKTWWYRALLHQVSLTPTLPSIECSGRETYYTRSV